MHPMLVSHPRILQVGAHAAAAAASAAATTNTDTAAAVLDGMTQTDLARRAMAVPVPPAQGLMAFYGALALKGVTPKKPDKRGAALLRRVYRTYTES